MIIIKMILSKFKKIVLKSNVLLFELKEVASILNYPYSSKETRKEIINGLISFISSSNKWQNISNKNI